MATRTFALTVAVGAPPDRVVDFLAALDRHVGIHPFLESAAPRDRGAGPDGPWQEWVVVEHPPGLRLRFTARMVRCTPTSLRTDVRAPLTRLEAEFVATAEAGFTTVAEACSVTAPWPLIGYATRNARRAHERTLAVLPTVLGDPP